MNAGQIVNISVMPNLGIVKCYCISSVSKYMVRFIEEVMPNLDISAKPIKTSCRPSLIDLAKNVYMLLVICFITSLLYCVGTPLK